MAKVKICGITSWEDARRACEAGADFLGFNFYKKSPRYISPSRADKIVGRLPRSVAAVGVFVNESPARIAEVARVVGLDYVQLHGDESPEMVEKVARELRSIVVSSQTNRASRSRGMNSLRGSSTNRTSAAKATLILGRNVMAKAMTHKHSHLTTQTLNLRHPKESASSHAGGAGVRVIKALRVEKGFRTAEMKRFRGVDAFLLDAFDAKARGGTGKTFDWSVAKRAATLKGRRIFLAGGLTPENAAEASRWVKPFALDVCSGVESAPGKKDAARMAAFVQAAKNGILDLRIKKSKRRTADSSLRAREEHVHFVRNDRVG